VLEEDLPGELDFLDGADSAYGVDIGAGPVAVDVALHRVVRQAHVRIDLPGRGHGRDIERRRVAARPAGRDPRLPVGADVDERRLDVGPGLEDIEIRPVDVDERVIGEAQRDRAARPERQGSGRQGL
jgi:hypothetical protein